MSDVHDKKTVLPSFDLKRNYTRVKDEIAVAVNRVLESQHFILGPEVEKFETAVSRYLEVPHAVGCASGTDALLLAMMALDIGPGDEVITTPFSFFSTVSCITRLGGTPVFVDVHPDTYDMNMEQVLEKVTARTKAVLPVHLFGQMAPIELIEDSLAKKGIPIVEDCAQAFGAHRKIGHKIMRGGAWGTIGCFSFFPTKNLGAYGDAGMTACHDDGIAQKLRKLRVHGSETTYFHETVGLNSRLDEIQAAILSVRLRYIESWTEERRQIASRYKLLFGERGLLDRVKIPAERPGNRHTYHQYVPCVERRDEAMRFLGDKGIVTRVYYPLALHLQPCFRYLGYGEGDFPVAEKLTREVMAFPMFPELQPEEQLRVADALAEFYNK